MRKIILLLFIVILLAGCSKEKDNSKDTMIQPEDQSTDQNDPDPTDASSGNQKSSQTSKNPSKAASGNSVQDHTVPGVTEVLQEGEVAEFTGAVGDAKIHMTLKYDKSQITGSYYYDTYGTEIKLDGSDQNIYQDYPTFVLTEDTDPQGQFIGAFINEDIIEGYWKSWNKLYPMYLIRSGSKANPPKQPGNAILQFDGDWYGRNTTYFAGTDMSIHVLFDDLLYFELSAHNGTATGALSGLAIYREGSARVTFREQINWEVPGSEHISFEFRKNADEITLLSNQYDYSCGMGVAFDDTYTSEEIKPAIPSLIDVGIVDNKEQQELFIKTVNYSDYSFLRNTQSVMYEEVLLDGRKVRAGTSYLRGASGLCYYINALDYMYAAIYDESSIQYYTNDAKYADHMPEPMKEWSESFGVEIVYNEITAPYPFDSSIPDLLVNQWEQLKKEQEITLPATYSLKDCSFGDLNLDGQEDFAAVVEQGPGQYTGSRQIYLFLNNKGNFKLAFENNSIVLGNLEGGAFGDPYEDISLSEGEFCVQDYGGSSDRWGHSYTFTYRDNKLILSTITLVGYNTFNLNGTINTYNLMSKKAETRTTYEPGEEDTTGKDYDDLLIYEGKIKLMGEIPFEEAAAWEEADFILEPHYPMPPLWNYDYGQKDFTGTRFTAEEILDKVKKKYYPGMKRIPIPCSQAILDNYSALLGYHVPTYYYSDGEHELYYYQMSYYEDSNQYHHSVFYDSIDNQWDDVEFYDLWDDTGEEDH